jgi:superfamily II DNA or RNA helicase
MEKMTETALTRFGYRLKKKDLTSDELEQLKKELHAVPFIPADFGAEAVGFDVWKEDNTYIYLPKNYGIEKYGPPAKTFGFDSKFIGKTNFDFFGKLRDDQMDVVNECMPILKSKGGGIMSLHCGFGKTTLSLYLASYFKLKTLVIVHKTFLQDQWMERISQFTNAKVGIIRQKHVDVENKDIVVGMLQSIAMRDYDPELLKQFGLVIVDECFPFETPIMTNNGIFTIGEIYDLWENKDSILPTIESYNIETQTFEYKKMTFAWKKSVPRLLTVTFNDQSKIRCTPNHKILTTSGYIEASKLTQHDLIVCNNTANAHSDKRKYLNAIDIQYQQNNVVTTVYDIEVEDNHNFTVVSNLDKLSGPIVHNCHRAPSRVFSQALTKTCSKYTIALSATPNRADGLTKVLKWFMGDIMCKRERKTTKKVFVKAFSYCSTDPLFVEKKMFILGSLKPAAPKMITNMCKIEGRNTFLINLITELRRQPDRKILILSGRAVTFNHLKILKEGVDKIIKEDEAAGLIEKDECKTFYYTGNCKPYERKEAEDNADIIFATFEMAQEGLDISRLNTIILATPKTSIVQSIGRIMRGTLKTAEINPLIIDITDELSSFRNQGEKRMAVYKKEKYCISHYKVLNDKIETKRDFLTRKYNMSKEDIDKELADNPDYSSELKKVIQVDENDVSTNVSETNSNDADSDSNDDDKKNDVVKKTLVMAKINKAKKPIENEIIKNPIKIIKPIKPPEPVKFVPKKTIKAGVQPKKEAFYDDDAYLFD